MRATVAGAVLLAATVGAHEVRPDAVLRTAGFGEREVQDARAGRVVTRLTEVPRDNAAFVVGVVRIAAEPSVLIARIRGLAKTQEATPEGRSTSGPLGSLAASRDLAGLRIDEADLRALRGCTVGDCDLQLDRATMVRARALDWTAEGADARAEALLKGVLASRIEDYRKGGTASLPTYDDGLQPEHVGRGLAEILELSPELRARNPDFYAYVRGYPRGPRPPGVEDFAYWSQRMLRRSIVSVVHAFLESPGRNAAGPTFVALKHVYDSRYFLAYAGFLTLFPEKDPHAFYLLRSVRALINPPRGRFRGFLLGHIKESMRRELARELAATRQSLERDQRAAAGFAER